MSLLAHVLDWTIRAYYRLFPQWLITSVPVY